jgi:hypothetical protein
MNEIFLNSTVGTLNLVSVFLYALALVTSLTFAIVYMTKIENILAGLTILLVITVTPTLLSKYIQEQIDNPFNELLEGTPYSFNSSLELLKSNEIKKTELMITDQSGFKMYSFSGQKESSAKPYSTIGKISCGSLTIKECVVEFKNNQDKIISSLNEEKSFEIVKNN